MAICGLNDEEYLAAVRSSVSATKVLLKRMPNAVRVNAYNPFTLYVWRGNMDIQFVTSVYEAAKYICGYDSKPNRGLSDLIKASNNELNTQPENPSLAQLRPLGSMFVRANEITAQGASILLFKHPLN